MLSQTTMPRLMPEGVPKNKDGAIEMDVKTIFNKLLDDIEIEIVGAAPHVKLNLTFPKWLTHGPYDQDTVDKFISTITEHLNNKCGGTIPETQTETDPKKLMNKIIKDLKIEVVNKQAILTFPQWFTHGPYEKETVDTFIKIITEQTMTQLNHDGMNCISYNVC